MPEGEGEEQVIENLLEKIMKENFYNLTKQTDIQVREAQRIPKEFNPNKSRPRHIIIKMQKFTERISKAARKRQRFTHKRVTIRLSADFSKEILQARRD